MGACEKEQEECERVRERDSMAVDERERVRERVYVKQKICKKYVWDRQRVSM
jgi:hypothetical protein